MTAEERNLEAVGRWMWGPQPSPSRMRYVRGRCYDFALALQAFLPSGELVVLGTAEQPEHAALRLPDGRLVDVRGATDSLDAFLRGFAIQGAVPVPVGRDALEAQCGLLGMEPPYRDSPDMREAMAAVRARFPGMRAVPVRRPEAEPTAPAPRP